MNSSKRPDETKPDVPDRSSSKPVMEEEDIKERIRRANYELKHGLPNTTGLHIYRTHRTIVKPPDTEKPKSDSSPD